MVDPQNPSDLPESHTDQPQESVPAADLSAPNESIVEAPKSSGGPLNLEQIRRMRQAQQQSKTGTARGPNPRTEKSSDARSDDRTAAKEHGTEFSVTTTSKLTESRVDTAPQPSASAKQAATSEPIAEAIDAEGLAPRYRSSTSDAPVVAPKVQVPRPNVRDSAEDSELAEAMAGADLDALMIGEKAGRVGVGLELGTLFQARVIKIHNANVFVSLGGPNEGVISLLQFTDMPTEGMQIDVVLRAFNAEEGLYECGIPGEAIAANDWGDLEEGAVVEAKIESANTGGVECKVGNIRGFIPISQLSEFRIESAADYVGQKLLCIVTEANPRRGNLVLSHRAVLEREKEQKKQERLANLEIGEVCEGVVRKVLDFGAFVDIGGLDGLIHISQLSWDKIAHPNEVVKEGDKVQVRIEKFDPKTGKISLSYRALQDDPWNDVEARFPTGTTIRGTVTRLANFGAFVKLATGIEGLIHISELAHRRVNNVSQVIQEGQEVEVKILTVDRNAQRIGLSLKATQAGPETARSDKSTPEPEEVKRESAVRRYEGQLRGGTGSSGGELFGLKL